jgi:methylmalonyl-CoA mutase cobalamin-binding subunit
LAALDVVAAVSAGGRFVALVAAARVGATVGELTTALRSGDEDPPRVAALRSRGGAAIFEDLRRDLLAWSARREGAPPPVLLARLGPAREHAGALDLARGVLAVSGLGVAECRADEAEALASQAIGSGPSAVVLVAGPARRGDAVPAFAGALRAALPDAWLALAGAPEGTAEREAWRAAGIDAVLHAGADVPAQLGELARRLGARP